MDGMMDALWIDTKSTANKAHTHEHYFFFFSKTIRNIAVRAEHYYNKFCHGTTEGTYITNSAFPLLYYY